MSRPFDPMLYLVTDSGTLAPEDFFSRVDAACRGGATLVQLREKERGGRDYLALARRVKEITDRYHIPLVIDDRVDVALACGAAGVHVGQSDLPVREARALIGPEGIVGATAKTVEQARAAAAAGADYLGVGAIYPTTTKVITVLTPVDTLRDICRAVSIPAVAIGGLNADNCGVLEGVPIAGIAVVSAIMKADSPAAAAAALRARVTAMIGRQHG